MKLEAEFEAFVNLRTKKQKLLHELHFLINCRREIVFPRFITQAIKSNHNKNYYLKRCQFRNRQALLRAAIKETRSNLAKNEIQLYNLHMKLSHNYHSIIWDHVDKTTYIKSTNQAETKSITLNRKLNQLMASKQRNSTNELYNTKEYQDVDQNFTIVENRSDIILSHQQLETLELGLNFALPHSKENIEDAVCLLENAIAKQEHNTANEIRTIIAKDILNNLKGQPTKPNNHASIIKSLTEEDVYILKADKGNKTVIVNRQNYEDGLQNILCDPNTYVKLDNNPTTNMVKIFKTSINACATLDDSQKSKLIPSKHSLPKIYAVPKIHKPNMPYRPIVSNLGSISHPLAKFISQKLKFVNSYLPHSISNSSKLLELLKLHPPSKDDILISFDVKNLFTSIPVPEAINDLEDKLMPIYNSNLSTLECHELINLTKICLDLTFFQHRNTYYKQIEGLAMGSPLSPLLANIFMDKIESNILSNTTFKPKIWTRYVDDVFCIWPHGLIELNQFFIFINTIHPSIQFTMEMENDNSLAFLDVNIKKNSDATFSTSVYRKPNSVCTIPHRLSNHPWLQKISGFHTLVHRAYILSSNEQLFTSEITLLKQLATARGYDKSIIDRLSMKVKNKLNITNNTTLQSQRQILPTTIIPYIPKISNSIKKTLGKYGIKTIFKPQQKIEKLTNKFKTRDPKEMQSGVYTISCATCQNNYIGQTCRPFKSRLAEHKRASGIIHKKFYPNKVKPEISAVAKHVKEYNHLIDWEQAKIIKQCPKQYLNQFESLFIYKNKSWSLNRKEDNNFPRNWHKVIDTIQRI